MKQFNTPCSLLLGGGSLFNYQMARFSMITTPLVSPRGSLFDDQLAHFSIDKHRSGEDFGGGVVGASCMAAMRVSMGGNEGEMQGLLTS